MCESVSESVSEWVSARGCGKWAQRYTLTIHAYCTPVLTAHQYANPANTGVVALVAAPHVGRASHHGAAGADRVEMVEALNVVGLQAH